ncbi:pyridoxamine 5'-phosphate oxidase family protein [Spongiactinospora sp. TRM90649]|uniref:pyridoxamine 5'-phosphate oxidase family protein n=1 Tax=Spongiactinospora sp. TRM90649 TaxID=3031114 RepID=UPI0023F85345|nr:pyridoxamine 5'-phosphate oxidase family protein [Spongiactinospora sp. TRM90649]MDF5757249.1 pyridoxamine 5'-phosphate oxidase family protein [Spongiactinospora sp. TRM90649]
MSSPLSSTVRTTLKRNKERGLTDREELYAVLDAGVICHLGVVWDGAPMVVPTGYGRIGDTLYLHGSTGARSLRVATGSPVCVTVTHLDGIVLARSIFHHSANYRSAMIYGTARVVDDPDEHLAGLRALAEQLAPGQWDTARPPTRKELAATGVLAVPLAEASVKTRTGPPIDDLEDHALPIWAGVLPARMVWGEPEPDEETAGRYTPPPHVTERTPIGVTPRTT